MKGYSVMQQYDFIYTAVYFFIYAFLGWCTEVIYAGFRQRRFVNRGFLNGPVCPIYGFGAVSVIAALSPYRRQLLLLFVLSFLIATLLEGATGFVLDRLFHHKWWDYSDKPFNIGGYVCLRFSVLWGLACVVIIRLIHPAFAFIAGKIPLPVLTVTASVFFAVIVTDTVITVLGILKFNRRLLILGNLSGEFAAELSKISDQIGQELFSRVKDVLDRQEKLNAGEIAETVSEEIRQRLSYIHERLENARIELSTPTFVRLVKAFPRHSSRQYGSLMTEPKERINELRSKLKAKKADIRRKKHDIK